MFHYRVNMCRNTFVTITRQLVNEVSVDTTGEGAATFEVGLTAASAGG
jgi:hypothetical protein